MKDVSTRPIPTEKSEIIKEMQDILEPLDKRSKELILVFARGIYAGAKGRPSMSA